MIDILNANQVDLIEEASESGGAIHLGNWEIVKNAEYFKQHEIKFILSAIPEFLADFKYIKNTDITQKVINAKDEGNWNMLDQLDEAADFIKASREKGNILVHCAAGISRSTTCLIAYYIKYKEMDMNSALKKIKAKRSIVCPNVGFQKQLKMYEQKIAEQRQAQ